MAHVDVDDVDGPKDEPFSRVTPSETSERGSKYQGQSGPVASRIGSDRSMK